MQGGFIPDVILYLSYFYTRTERMSSLLLVLNVSYQDMPLVPIRLAWFWVSNYMSHIIGAFLATGILRMRGINGHAGWRYLFLIEGGFTLLIGLLSFVLMPPGPTQTKAWYRPKGWFTERCVLFPRIHTSLSSLFASAGKKLLWLTGKPLSLNTTSQRLTFLQSPP